MERGRGVEEKNKLFIIKKKKKNCGRCIVVDVFHSLFWFPNRWYSLIIIIIILLHKVIMIADSVSC